MHSGVLAESSGLQQRGLRRNGRTQLLCGVTGFPFNVTPEEATHPKRRS